MDIWEILVPVCWNDGMIISLQHHYKWDAEVSRLTNGLMLKGTTVGRWGLKKEEVILVQIACDKNIIDEIARITKSHYQQNAVLYYKVAGPAFLV